VSLLAIGIKFKVCELFTILIDCGYEALSILVVVTYYIFTVVFKGATV
jgi:hypothetical protein